MNYIEFQNEIIHKYNIHIEEHSKCWGRTHAHVKERKVCKWQRKSSYEATVTLLHEIGHIETTKSNMRRAEEEYYATVWAIDRLLEYGFPVKDKFLFVYQRYILTEIRRGERRGGKAYGDLNLYHYVGKDISMEDVYNMCDERWQKFIDGTL